MGSKEDALGIFQQLDRDGSGALDKDELWVVLAASGEDYASQMIDMVDTDGDGLVDLAVSALSIMPCLMPAAAAAAAAQGSSNFPRTACKCYCCQWWWWCSCCGRCPLLLLLLLRVLRVLRVGTNTRVVWQITDAVSVSAAARNS